MAKSKKGHGSSPPAKEPNPFCPVCGGSGEEDLSTTAGSQPRKIEGHNCLLSIINTHYLLIKKEMGEGE